MSIFFDQRSSQGHKVIERLRNAHGNENSGRKNPKIRVENRHEAKKAERDNDFCDITTDGTMEDNHYSGMMNAGVYYGCVLRVEMM